MCEFYKEVLVIHRIYTSYAHDINKLPTELRTFHLFS